MGSEGGGQQRGHDWRLEGGLRSEVGQRAVLALIEGAEDQGID